jgi:hypothetical protein
MVRRLTGEGPTMNRDPRHPSHAETTQARANSAGPLPAEFDRRLVAVDDALARKAGSVSTPRGLNERVYRASVSHLPAHPADAPLRFPQRAAASMRSSAWGRLAVAASVALACVVAAWFHTSAPTTAPSERESIAQHTPASADELETTALPSPVAVTPTRIERLSPAAVWLLHEATQSGYLYDTRDLTHEEAVSDLALVYEQLSEL